MPQAAQPFGLSSCGFETFHRGAAYSIRGAAQGAAFASMSFLQSRDVLPGKVLQLVGPPKANELTCGLHSRGFTSSTDSEHVIGTEDSPKSKHLWSSSRRSSRGGGASTCGLCFELTTTLIDSFVWCCLETVGAWFRTRRTVSWKVEQYLFVLEVFDMAREKLSATRGESTGRGRGARGQGSRGTATGSADDG